MDEDDAQDWAGQDDESTSTSSKIVSVALLVVIGLVSLSLVPTEQEPGWQVVYGIVGLGSIGYGLKAARE